MAKRDTEAPFRRLLDLHERTMGMWDGEVAEAVGLSKAHFSRVMRGLARPSRPAAARIAWFLDLPIAEFWRLWREAAARSKAKAESNA